MQTLNFDNQFLQALPADPVTENHRRQITGAIYSHVNPASVKQPYLVAHSQEAAALIGLDDADCTSPSFLEIFSGNATLPGMQLMPLATGGTSSVIGRVSWVTDVQSTLAKSTPPKATGCYS